MAKPRSLGTAKPDAAAERAIAAVQRCAPFFDAATPGPPRSYEINLG